MTNRDDTPGILDVLEYKKPIRQHIREFAGILAVVFLAYAGYQLHFYNATLEFAISVGLTLLILGLGYLSPITLYPVWRGWMKIAVILGSIVTSIILAIMWLGVFIPLAIILKMVGKRVMDTTFERSRESYWNTRDEKFHDFKLLERQF